MAITAGDVKSLREKTGAGMMDCKKALSETNGDVEAAVDYLRKKGLAAVAKKQSRVAAEGAVLTVVEGNVGVVVEVNCETDFVAKGDDFQGFVREVASHVVTADPGSVEALKNQTNDRATELTLKCGEKVDVRRYERFELSGSGVIANYNHGGKIGVLVEVAAGSNNDKVQELGKDLAMHVAAADPKFVRDSEIDESFKQREAEIYTAQLKEQGKPEKMIPQIVQGKLKKLASEVCLLEQKFVKNPDLTVKKLLAESGADADVKRFVKVDLGAGIEKREDNLAEEVAKMTQKQ